MRYVGPGWIAQHVAVHERCPFDKSHGRGHGSGGSRRFNLERLLRRHRWDHYQRAKDTHQDPNSSLVTTSIPAIAPHSAYPRRPQCPHGAMIAHTLKPGTLSSTDVPIRANRCIVTREPILRAAPHRMAQLTRRAAIELVGAAAAGVTLGGNAGFVAAETTRLTLKGNVTQSVCRWCYRDIPLHVFFRQVADLGLTAIDLLDEDEWPVAGQYGLACSTGYGGGGTVTDGLNDPANHQRIIRNLERSLPKAATESVPNVVTFVGCRRGMSDARGVDHCVAVLKKVAPVAESEDVTVVVELLNSLVDYPDYQGDRSAFGVEVIKRVDSPRVKLLYDIYHMQIMEGDIIRTIRNNHMYVAHYHTGGVSGRHELDDSQELNWPAVVRAIVKTGYRGYLAHEFVPRGTPMASLRNAVRLCDV